jgi:predicted nucleotidyltransferase
MPIFRSQHQAELLTQLYLHPGREYTLADLAGGAGIPASTAHRELARLTDAGLVTSRPVGRTRLHQANTTHPGARALTELLTLAFGPGRIVAEEFAELAGVERVLLFGSWAARHAGQDGPPPADIDVLVVGAVSRPEVYDAAERAAQRLQLPVNPALRTPGQWAEAQDALVAQVQESVHVTVIDRSAEGSSGMTESSGQELR